MNENFILNKNNTDFLKAVFYCSLQREGGLLNFPGIFAGEGIVHIKKMGVLKIANSGNFEIVNFIQIGRFLTVL